MKDHNTDLESPLINEMEEVHLQRLFKRITLSLASVFFLYPVPEEAVWDATRCLDNIFRDELGIPSKDETEARTHKHSQGRKHPAVCLEAG